MRLSSSASASAALLALLLPACMPPSWAANAMLHPGRRAELRPTPLPHETVTFEGAGVRLEGWWFHARPPVRGTIVYLHGIGDNRSSGAFVAERFVSRGFDVVMYDQRAHGRSEGDACTYGFYEKQDLVKVLDRIDARPIVVMGSSLGGAVALQAASQDRRIAVVIAVATFSDLRIVAGERAPFFASEGNVEAAFRLAERDAHFRVDDASPRKAAPFIKVPVLLIHGAEDDETPPTHSQRVYDALTSPKRLLLVPKAKHNDALRAESWAAIDAWLGEHGKP